MCLEVTFKFVCFFVVGWLVLKSLSSDDDDDDDAFVKRQTDANIL